MTKWWPIGNLTPTQDVEYIVSWMDRDVLIVRSAWIHEGEWWCYVSAGHQEQVFPEFYIDETPQDPYLCYES